MLPGLAHDTHSSFPPTAPVGESQTCDQRRSFTQPFTMLTYPDRRKFQQIRAQWELAQSPGSSPSLARMVGRKEKASGQQKAVNENGDFSTPSASTSATPGGSAFRRKLSRGMSFISHPLSQRKVTPGRRSSGRQEQERPLPAPPGPKESRSSDRLLSPIHDPTTTSIQSSPVRSRTPTLTPTRTSSIGSSVNSIPDPESTPKPTLPRAATLSYIPRPSRSNSEVSLPSPMVATPRALPAPAPLIPVRMTPTKIPTPSPPRDPARKCTSPRQYKGQHSARQDSRIIGGSALAAVAVQSPPRATRAYTTSALPKGSGIRPPQPAFMVPRTGPVKSQTPAGELVKSLSMWNLHTAKGSIGIGIEKLRLTTVKVSRTCSSMKENTPTGQRDSRRFSQIQSEKVKRESLVPLPPAAVSNRRSAGPNNNTEIAKPHRGTPTTVPKRSSTYLPLQSTPLTAKRVPTNRSQPITSHRSSNGSLIAQSRLMGQVHPPTPTRSDTSNARSQAVRSSNDRDARRRNFGTPSVSTSSAGSRTSRASVKSLLGTKSEVRLPRSKTLSHIPRYGKAVPPVPTIRRVVSTPPPSPTKPPVCSSPVRRTVSHKVDIVDSKIEPMAASPLERLSQFTFGLPARTDYSKAQDTGHRASSVFETDPESEDGSSNGDSLTALPLMAKPSQTFTFGHSRPPRPFIVHEAGSQCANKQSSSQVKDYMPALWWAGRFQTRFDQWRMDAMRAELDASYRLDGMLGSCKLSDERVAACYIFRELRELCVTSKAADSLWVCRFLFTEHHFLVFGEGEAVL